MPRTTKPPAYRMYRRTGQAVVTLGGKDFYLGPYGTKVSRDAYDRLVGEWLVNGRRVPAREKNTDGATTMELIAAYWGHCREYYRNAGELGKIRIVIRTIRRLYGHAPVQDFGPLALKNVRQVLVSTGIGRKHVNDQIGRIKRMFRWGVENELVPASVYQALQAVSGLPRGRTDAPESKRVTPVPDEFVDAIQPHVSRQVWAIVQLQRLTGMRSSEVLLMRGCDLDMTGNIWLYKPEKHKT